MNNGDKNVNDKAKDVKKPDDSGPAKSSQQDEDDLDDALDQSFPASDPPPQTQPTKKVGGTNDKK